MDQAEEIAHKLTASTRFPQDASFKKVVIILSFQACGRCGEVASCSWRLIMWNYTYQAPVFTWIQLKTSTSKPVVLLPSRDSMKRDVHVAVSDAAANGQFNIGGPAFGTEPKLLFNQFATVEPSGVAPKISRMLQDMVPGSKSQLDKDGFSAPSMEGTDPSSHDLRHGCIQHMEGRGGCEPSFVSDLSGHAPEVGGRGALHTAYHKVTLPRVIIGELCCCLLSPVPLGSFPTTI